jgi:hypothetical protein
MPTTFDFDTFPLETKTKFTPRLGTKLDVMTDGTPRLRVLTTLKPIDINCVFSPQSEEQSAAFESYLYDNAAIEFDIPHNSKTYRGYIDGDTLDKSISNGVTHWWSFTFVGRAV